MKTKVKELIDLTPQGYPGYTIAADGRIWSYKSNKFLTPYNNFVQLSLGTTIKCANITKLYAVAFGTILDDIPDEDKRNLGFLGFPMYTVTRDGRVWSHGNNRFLIPQVTPPGYVKVVLCHESKGTNFRIHRLVGLAFIPNPDNLPEVNHKKVEDINGKPTCDKSNNHVDNLEWSTQLDNSLHALENNLTNSSMSKDQVHEACLMLEQGEEATGIARILDVKPSAVQSIKNKVSHVRISNQYTIPKTKKGKYNLLRLRYAKLGVNARKFKAMSWISKKMFEDSFDWDNVVDWESSTEKTNLITIKVNYKNQETKKYQISF